MIIGGKTWPQDRKWVIAVLAVSVLAVTAYAVEWSAVGTLPGGSSHSGFLYGIAGGLIILFELLLWPRKHVRAWRIGSAQAWLRAHVWLGLLSVPLVVMHAKLFFIGGLLNLALMWTFVIVIGSGVWGLVLQQFLPKLLLKHVPAETIYDQIEHVAAQQAADAENLVRALCEPVGGVSDHEFIPGAAESEPDDRDEEAGYAVITGFRSMTGIQGKVLETVPIHSVIPHTQEVARRFQEAILPYLRAGVAGGSPLAGRLESWQFFASLRADAPAAAGDLINQLEQMCENRRQFDLQSRLHGWLHGWLLVHVPVSVALGILLAIHVPVALWYW
ncbi:MAG: hypothetical protein K8S94_01490 [Planctomycetia bacterium]|nr:hypothetical protein [Planctomycetia bacterium]